MIYVSLSTAIIGNANSNSENIVYHKHLNVYFAPFSDFLVCLNYILDSFI